MKSRLAAGSLTTLMIALCAGLSVSAAASANVRQPPAAAASESSVTLKAHFKAGAVFRYKIKIDRTDANIVPAAMMQPPAAPPAPAAPTPKADPDPKPAGDAPKSDPGVIDPAPRRSTTDAPSAAAQPEGKPAAPAAETPAAEPEKKDTISATSRVVLDTVQALKVKEVTDAGMTLELVFESVKADITMPEKQASYDSAIPEDDKDRDNLALQTFKPIVGLALELKADKDGNITEVKGNEGVQNASSPALSGYLQSLTGSDNIRINWNMILHAKKGGGTFKVGDTWSNEEAIVAKQMGAKFELMTTSTLRSVAAGAASIDSTGAMRLVPNDPNRKPPFELKDAKLLQTSTWDAAEGVAVRGEFQRSFRLDGSAQGFPLTRQSDIKMTVERVK